jgi:pyruvate/2-oxoglutarate dehydrogenase complex dihydrolipoamide dehydrogenase (E3) component
VAVERSSPAWTFAAEGQRGALVARKYTGGFCPNIACRPSRNIIHSASVAVFVCGSKEFGIATGRVSVDMSRVRHSKRRMVADLVDLDIAEYRKSGAEVILGFARFYRRQDGRSDAP